MISIVLTDIYFFYLWKKHLKYEYKTVKSKSVTITV